MSLRCSGFVSLEETDQIFHSQAGLWAKLRYAKLNISCLQFQHKDKKAITEALLFSYTGLSFE